MSKQIFECIIGKIVLDASFGEALISDPDLVLSNFDLSESEKAWLKRIDYETMEALASLALHIGKISISKSNPMFAINTKGEDKK